MKPKPKVVMELYQRGAELKGRVLKMDEKLRGSGLITRLGGWSLRSEEFPQLSVGMGVLYLPGRNRKRDKKALRCDVWKTPEAASLAVTAIRALLDKVNGVEPASKWVKVI
jgi:hypothetical protein